MSSNIKSEFIGMSIGTANGRLRKTILFDLVKKLKLDNCYRCNLKINNVNEFSIEHKKAWLHVDPKLFWDLNNIAFSHLNCNSQARRVNGTPAQLKAHSQHGVKVSKYHKAPIGTKWCSNCKQYISLNKFTHNKSKRDGYETICIPCRSIIRKANPIGDGTCLENKRAVKGL